MSGGNVTPKAAELAAELSLDLSTIEGSGKGGKITIADVRSAGITEPTGKLAAEAVLSGIRDRAQVVDVFGPKRSRTLIEIPTELAAELLERTLALSGPHNVVDAVEADLAAIAERDPDAARSSEAAAAIQLAYELQNPYNSATSKSMCAKALIEALNTVRELAPEPEEDDELDDLAEQRAKRRAEQAALRAADTAG